MLGSPPNAQALLRQAGLRAKKSWGQNFLGDQEVLRIIAQATEAGPEVPVVELGAGLGALTYHLLQQGGRVIAIERDRDLVPPLQAALGCPQLEICEADAARLDYAALAQACGGPVQVAGNLPYQLSSRILVSLADAADHVAGAVLLVQREVAERLVAAPGRDYGLLSVLVQRAFDVELLRIVSPKAFFPSPKVESAVVRLRRRAQRWEPTADANLVRAARAAFSARRKTLRNSVSGACHAVGADIAALLEGVQISPGARAETLHLDDFARLGAALAAHGHFTPPTMP